MTPEQLCQSAGTQPFQEFFQKVHDIQFKEQPDYECLQKMLKEIIDQNKSSNENEFDWLVNSNMPVA